jgi:Uma2 family endonuclease
VSTLSFPAGQKLLLHDIDWKTYERFLRALADRPSLRLTYDRGSLEIMTLSHEHESISYFLSRLIDALTEELGLPVKGGRSTTFRRQKRRRGLEPDGCWWIASEALVRGKTKIHLRRDPPPDLGLEIDITHSSLDRLTIYAALGISEVWRFDGKTIACYILGPDQKYTLSNTSRGFPGLVPADLARFLGLRGQMDENAAIRQFRTWVRQQLMRGGTSQPAP